MIDQRKYSISAKLRNSCWWGSSRRWTISRGGAESEDFESRARVVQGPKQDNLCEKFPKVFASFWQMPLPFAQLFGKLPVYDSSAAYVVDCAPKAVERPMAPCADVDSRTRLTRPQRHTEPRVTAGQPTI
jgi:hypothetical protein